MHFEIKDLSMVTGLWQGLVMKLAIINKLYINTDKVKLWFVNVSMCRNIMN